MKAFIKKYYEAIIYLLELPSNTKRLKNIRNQNTALRENKSSDIERWSVKKELSIDWNERTAILGNFITPNAAIIEFGAGSMFLKDHLNNYKSYMPSDIIKRFPETLVCDLNEPLTLDLTAYDTAVFSGVLEYVYDIEALFQQINCINQVVLSYCCSDVMKVSREANGWLSDYTTSELEAMFGKNGYKIEHYQEWKKQSLYNLIKIK